MTCQHMNFDCFVTVNRIEDVGRFSADVKIKCDQCGLPFRFIGLPHGVDLNGACVNIDATEACLAIAPKGEVISNLEGAPSGFSCRRIDHLDGWIPADMVREAGEYWWWNQDPDSAPVPVTVAKGFTGGKYLFAETGQLGWNRAQMLPEMGGWWKLIPQPEIPKQLLDD